MLPHLWTKNFYFFFFAESCNLKFIYLQIEMTKLQVNLIDVNKKVFMKHVVHCFWISQLILKQP